MVKLKTFIPIFVFVSLIFLLKNSLDLNQNKNESFAEIDKLPTFNLKSFYDNAEISNNILEGKFTVLNIWASWCSSCIQEHSTFFDIKSSTKLQIIGVAFNDEPQDIEKFVEKHGNPYDYILEDYKGKMLVNLGLRSLPITFLINEQGNVVKSHLGILTPAKWKEDFLPALTSNYILF